ncbi:ATPase [Candidatus Micrarchaeota archaeon RBG_16_36_9]|nr:MAG: ATPase [Candidatus Micrarchaeota archaeon RBG_16_36_9]
MKKRRKFEEREFDLNKICTDTSALISGRITELINSNKLNNSEIIIPEIVVGELQAQAAKGKEIGFIGLDELKRIRELADKHKLVLKFVGDRPSYEDILLARSGRIDSLIQDIAKENNAVLVTSDLLQGLVAQAQGIKVKYFDSYEKKKRMKIESFLTSDTISLHLKENAIPFAKRGKPGETKLVPLKDKPLKSEELDEIATEILDAARYEEDSFIELGEHGATVIQLKDKRIAIARPPFSDGLEVTLVRPIVKLTLDDYKLSTKLKERLEKRAEGIIVAGPPGSGKSTFSASLAEFYFKKGKIVKTMEQPRDLQVPTEITQYAPLGGSFLKTANILLLVRPDYTIFDDIRNPKDFEIFSDLRLAGIGMIGVVHASDPVDAIQRFIGKIDLGVIPHVIDTIIFIKDGKIEKIFSLSLTVRVPTGMTEDDLTRPLIEVRDFENQNLEYEIYIYGEQTTVVPVKKEKKTGLQKLAIERMKSEIGRFDPSAEIELVSDNKAIVKVNNKVIPKLIGRDGKTIKSIEDKLGISIEVQPMVESLGKEIDYDVNETGAYIVFSFDNKISGKNANIYVSDEYLFSATIGRTGQIKISKNSELGKSLLRAITGKKEIKVFI